MPNSGAKGTGGIGKEKWVFIWVTRGTPVKDLCARVKGAGRWQKPSKFRE